MLENYVWQKAGWMELRPFLGNQPAIAAAQRLAAARRCAARARCFATL